MAADACNHNRDTLLGLILVEDSDSVEARVFIGHPLQIDIRRSNSKDDGISSRNAIVEDFVSSVVPQIDNEGMVAFATIEEIVTLRAPHLGEKTGHCFIEGHAPVIAIEPLDLVGQRIRPPVTCIAFEEAFHARRANQQVVMIPRKFDVVGLPSFGQIDTVDRYCRCFTFVVENNVTLVRVDVIAVVVPAPFQPVIPLAAHQHISFGRTQQQIIPAVAMKLVDAPGLQGEIDGEDIGVVGAHCNDRFRHPAISPRGVVGLVDPIGQCGDIRINVDSDRAVLGSRSQHFPRHEPATINLDRFYAPGVGEIVNEKQRPLSAVTRVSADIGVNAQGQYQIVSIPRHSADIHPDPEVREGQGVVIRVVMMRDFHRVDSSRIID